MPVLLWAAWRHHGEIPWRWLPFALLAGVAVGGSSYINAWWVTGNPVLPLMNASFRSPYFALRDLSDDRWRGGLDVDVLWDLSFDSGPLFRILRWRLRFRPDRIVGAWFWP